MSSDETPRIVPLLGEHVRAFMAEHANEWLPGGGGDCNPLCVHLWQPVEGVDHQYDLFVSHHPDCPQCPPRPVDSGE